MRALLLLASVPLLAQDFFPLAEGNEWIFTAPRGGQLRISVGAASEIAGKTYFELTGYANKNLRVRRDEAGDLVQWDEPTGAESVVTRFGPAGAAFASGAGFCGEEGTVRGPARAAGLDAWEIRYRPRTCADAGLEQEFFAPNVGLVRRVQQSIIGPVAFDLVSAKVGPLVYRPDTAGASASITVAASVSSGTVSGSISVNVRGPAPLKLTFPSSQRFDVALYGPDGRHLWTWSADKLFAAVITDEEWTGENRFEWTLPASGVGKLAPGVHRVEAWIVSGQRRVLAASTPLPVEP